MRSNYRHIEQIGKEIESISLCLRKAKTLITFGLKGRQWIASSLICVILLPIFSPPARGYDNFTVTDTDTHQYEPVNEQLPIWTQTWRNLNVRLESWLTSLRNETAYGDENDNEKKNAADKKRKARKGGKNEEKEIKTNAEKVSSEAEPAGALPEEEKKNLKTEIAKTEEKVSPPSGTKNAAPINTKNKVPVVSPAPMFNQLPLNERESVYSAVNNLGSPFGQIELDSTNQASALRIHHRAGVANFSFDIPLAGLMGRGVDVGVALAYNSLAWNQSVTVDQNNNVVPHFTYDVEQSWIAPGFSSGFGYLETVAQSRNIIYAAPHNSWHTEIMPLGLTDADGTRHQLQCKSYSTISGTNQPRCNSYATTDGTFVEFAARPWIINPNNSPTPYTGTYNQASFSTTYPDGMKVWYSGGFGSGDSRKHYPLVIQDRNGNRLRIAYKADESGRIDYIRDTLNRDIKFYYGTDNENNPNKLVAITIPGMGENQEIQTVRFYYETLTLQTGGFVSNAVVTAPTTINVLKYVYVPGTKSGYKYEYHPKYGMIKKITRLYGMQGSTDLTTTTGAVTEGIWAAKTEYDFPDGSTPLDVVPKFTKRTDDWQGRTSASPMETLYDAPEPTGSERVTTVSVKDNGFDVAYQTISHVTNDWKDGLVKETTIKKIYGPTGQYSTLMSKVVYFWDPGQIVFGGRQNPKLSKVEITNDAGLTRANVFGYDQYNNQTVIEEHDYAAPSSLGTLLRRTQTTFEDGAGWISANLLNLPRKVETIVGNTTVSKTEIQYDHNGNDSTIVRHSDIDINTHSTFYNPDHPAWTETICPDGQPEVQSVQPGGCITIYHPGYSAASAYRGNVTKVTRFSDATLTTDPNAEINNYNYDIAGSPVESTLNCCQVKTISYHKDSEYAFPISETRGSTPNQLSTSATYNRNTSLVLTSTDENGQVTTYQYETDTLRQKKIIYPNGGYMQTEYSDKLVTNTNELVPNFRLMTQALDSTGITQNYTYFDGRGSAIRDAGQTPNGWNILAVEYDKLGREIKSYNPFSGATPTATVPVGTKYSEILSIDALSRTTSIKFQDNTTISREFSDTNITPSGFNKTFVTITDQAGKKRRQVVDALGRLVRVDEPDLNNNLGAVDNPNQPTLYEHDGNDNLSKITQSNGVNTQERLFKHDALSRLTHERQVEANATLDNVGVKQTSGGLWTKVMKYNTSGLLVDGYDARGVNAHFIYDGLNRVSTITFSDGTPQITYTYDQERAGYYNKGLLTRVETAEGNPTTRPDTPSTSTEFDHDKMGQIVKQRQSIGSQTYNLEYSFNLAGQLISEKYPSGRIVSAGYDTKGRLTSVSDQNRSYLTDAQYQHPAARLTSMTLGNGNSQTFEFNDRLQMSSQTLLKGAEVIQRYEYGYGQIDSNGNLDAAKNNNQLAKIESYIGANKQWTQKFTYDALGRLGGAEEYRGGDTNALSYKQKFDYDRFGNFYRKQSSNPTAGQQTPIAFTPIEDADIDKSRNRLASNTIYDDAGNVTRDTKFRNRDYKYDANGRMYWTKLADGTGLESTSVYDASGQRVAEKNSGIWRFLVYNAFGHLVAEYGGMSQNDEGGVKYILQDTQGSTRAILNNAGFVQTRKDFQAFGEDIDVNIGLRTQNQGYGTPANLRQSYAETERDEATGLDHTGFRKYENKGARWTSPDPFTGSINLANPQSLNRYTYVENEPTNFHDPSGLQLAVFMYPRFCIIRGEASLCWAFHIMNIPDPTSGGNEPGGGGQGQTQEKKCSVAPLKPITDPLGQRFEAARGKIFDEFNMTLGTRRAFTCFQAAIRTARGDAVGESGFRPRSYQDHFLDLWEKWKVLQNNKQKECRKLKEEVKNELINIHQITGAPIVNSSHVQGTAFDVVISGVSNKQISAAAQKCNLRRARGDGEGHHFNFIGEEPKN
jgi:RHS repeat-associated protein